MGLKPRPAPLLAGLDDVAWSELETAHGPATELPHALRQLTARGARTRRAACDQIEDAIDHQGWASPAAAAAVPFLIELACDPRVSDRGRLITLLGNLAVGGMHTEFLRDGDRRPRTAPAEAAFLDDIRAAIAGALDRFVALLDDDDAAVRAAAPFLLAFVGEHAEATAPAVAARLAREREPIARASVLIATAMLDQYLARRNNLPRFTAALASGDELERVAGAIALSYLAPLSPEVVQILAEASRGDQRALAGFPWGDGDLADLAARILRLRGGTQALLDSLLALPIPGFGTDPARSIAITRTADQLLRMVFPQPLAAGAAADALDQTQRRVVTALSRDSHYWNPQTATGLGLPASPEEARSWLGLPEPPPPETILDRELTVDGETKSLRAWWIAASQEPALAQRLVTAIADRMEVEDTIELVLHAHCDLPHPDHGPESASMQLQLLSAHGDRAESALRQLATRLLEQGPPTARRLIHGRWSTVLFSRLYGYLGAALARLALARGDAADDLCFELLQRQMSSLPELPEIRQALGAFAPERAATLILDSAKYYYWPASTHPWVIATVHRSLPRFRSRDDAERLVSDFVAALRAAGQDDEAAALDHHLQRFLAGETLIFDEKSSRIA